MRSDSLTSAISEAERFLLKAKAAKKIVDTNSECEKRSDYTNWTHSSVEVAACKRASMDLSRALSDLRRP